MPLRDVVDFTDWLRNDKGIMSAVSIKFLPFITVLDDSYISCMLTLHDRQFVPRWARFSHENSRPNIYSE